MSWRKKPKKKTKKKHDDDDADLILQGHERARKKT